MAITIPDHTHDDDVDHRSDVITDVFGDSPDVTTRHAPKRHTEPPRVSGDIKMLRDEIRSVRHSLNQAFIAK